jgi:hypothetical protein
MEIKLELDTEKTAKTAVAIASTYSLCRVSKTTDFPQPSSRYSTALARPPQNPPNQA